MFMPSCGFVINSLKKQWHLKRRQIPCLSGNRSCENLAREVQNPGEVATVVEVRLPAEAVKVLEEVAMVGAEVKLLAEAVKVLVEEVRLLVGVVKVLEEEVRLLVGAVMLLAEVVKVLVVEVRLLVGAVKLLAVEARLPVEEVRLLAEGATKVAEVEIQLQREMDSILYDDYTC